MPRTASLGIRVEPDLKERLERAAKADRRTVAALIEKVMEEWLAANGYPSQHHD
jgi:predicted transcriptional regulator